MDQAPITAPRRAMLAVLHQVLDQRTEVRVAAQRGAVAEHARVPARCRSGAERARPQRRPAAIDPIARKPSKAAKVEPPNERKAPAAPVDSTLAALQRAKQKRDGG